MIDTNKLKHILKEKDLTKQQLAILAKVSYDTIKDILNEQVKNSNKDTVQRIAIALEVSLDEITK